MRKSAVHDEGASAYVLIMSLLMGLLISGACTGLLALTEWTLDANWNFDYLKIGIWATVVWSFVFFSGSSSEASK